MKKYILTLFTIAIVLGAIVYFAGSNRRETERKRVASTLKNDADKPVPVKIAMKWFFAGTMAPYFAAKYNGVFRKSGVEVELLPGGPSAPSIDNVLLGNAEFGITGAHDLAISRAKDQPLVAVAVIFKRSPTCLLTLQESGISSPSQLADKTVELTRGDNSEFEVLAMLAKYNVVLPEKRRPVFKYNYESLQARQVDAAVAYENDQAITEALEDLRNVPCRSWGNAICRRAIHDGRHD